MAELVVRAVRAADCARLAHRMRDADIAELRAVGLDDREQAVRDSVALSTVCWAIEADGALACIMGVAPLDGLLSDRGSPWMLGTPLVQRHGRALVRLSRGYIARMLEHFPRLTNFVHADNAVAVRWLAASGFVLQPAAPFGPRGALFHRFDMEA